MSRSHAAVRAPSSGGLHLEVHRSILSEVLAGLGLAALWTLLWFAFVAALAVPGPARSAVEEQACNPSQDPVIQARADQGARPDQGAPTRGVAACRGVSAG